MTTTVKRAESNESRRVLMKTGDVAREGEGEREGGGGGWGGSIRPDGNDNSQMILLTASSLRRVHQEMK